MSSPLSRRHDQSYKLLFSIPLAIHQLIRHFLDADLADALDFKKVEILATERVSAGLVRSHADLLWKIHFRGSRRHLLLAIEVLDLREQARQPLPQANVVSWIASLELDPSPNNVSRVVQRVQERYPGAEHARLREAFREWVLGAAESWGIGEDVLEEVKSLKEAEMIYAGVEELKEGAHRQGRTTLVYRLARVKFGVETAERLSQLMEGITDPERIARIGERIIECETGAELLASARQG